MKHASFRAALIALVLAALGAVILLGFPKYWVFLITAVFIVGIALQSLGLVAGRTGMISLCQMSFAGVGAWVTGYLNLIEAPGGLAVWVLLGGLAAVPVGIAIGLPALRLRGINLAIVTLSFAAAFDTVLATITFPGQTSFTQVARPDLFASDRGYFLFVLLAYGIIAVVLEFISHSRLGA
ncbi:ABC transporter permease subunit, partial [Brucella suis]